MEWLIVILILAIIAPRLVAYLFALVVMLGTLVGGALLAAIAFFGLWGLTAVALMVLADGKLSGLAVTGVSFLGACLVFGGLIEWCKTRKSRSPEA